MRPRRPHRLRLARSSRSGRPARRHAPGSRQQYGASSSPQKLLSGTHGVDDDDCCDALNVANLENKGSPVGSQEHGETISHIPGSDGVVIGVKDVGLAQAVLQRRSGNDRIVHRSKVTCDVLCGRGVWSGVTVVVVAGLTARWACGCRRCVGCHRRRAGRSCVPGCRSDGCRHIGAGLSLLRTGVTIGDYSGWCSIGRQPRRGDLGASVLVRAGCGEGECGGARLVGSEKSPIVTRRWCVGPGCPA